MSKKKNVLIGAIALSLVVSTGAVAFAATGTDDAQQKKSEPAVMAGMTQEQRDAVRQARTDSMKEAAAELVEKGSITQDIADKLTEVKESQAKDKGGLGALTDDQRTALRDAEAAEIKSGLADLVKAGTITQEQADQIAQDQVHRMMQGLDLTDTQRDALMQIKMAAREAAAAALVEKGTLTQDAADAMTATPKSLLTEEQKTAIADSVKANFESKLSALVDKGTITQEQADQLLSDPGALHMGPGGTEGSGHGGPGGTEGSGPGGPGGTEGSGHGRGAAPDDPAQNVKLSLSSVS